MNDFTRRRLVGVMLLLAAFVAGVAIGVAVDRRLRASAAGQIRVIGDMSAVLDKLQLTPAQRTQARDIVERSAPRTARTMVEAAERLRAISDSIDSELRVILTPSQRTRLDSMRAGRRMLLRRKLVTPSGTRIDTVFAKP